jgi:hypothetical protein
MEETIYAGMAFDVEEHLVGVHAVVAPILTFLGSLYARRSTGIAGIGTTR